MNQNPNVSFYHLAAATARALQEAAAPAELAAFTDWLAAHAWDRLDVDLAGIDLAKE